MSEPSRAQNQREQTRVLETVAATQGSTQRCCGHIERYSFAKMAVQRGRAHLCRYFHPRKSNQWGTARRKEYQSRRGTIVPRGRCRTACMRQRCRQRQGAPSHLKQVCPAGAIKPDGARPAVRGQASHRAVVARRALAGPRARWQREPRTVPIRARVAGSGNNTKLTAVVAHGAFVDHLTTGAVGTGRAKHAGRHRAAAAGAVEPARAFKAWLTSIKIAKPPQVAPGVARLHNHGHGARRDGEHDCGYDELRVRAPRPARGRAGARATVARALAAAPRWRRSIRCDCRPLARRAPHRRASRRRRARARRRHGGTHARRDGEPPSRLQNPRPAAP